MTSHPQTPPAFALTFSFDHATNRLRAIAKSGDTIIGELPLDVAAVEELQRNLAAARSHMKPDVPAELPAGQLSAVTDPRWWTEPHLSGGTVLAFRHPGYGWLGYLVPPESRDQLHALLGRQIAHPVPMAPPSGKPS